MRESAIATAGDVISGIVDRIDAEKKHPPGCQCTECVESMFTGNIERIKGGNGDLDENQELLKQSLETDEKERELANKKAIEGEGNNKLANFSHIMNVILVYFTASGIMIAGLSMLVTLIINPTIQTSLAHAVTMIVLGIINERIK